MPTTRYECILCDEHHLVKSEDYGKHLMKHHQETLLVSSSLYYMTLNTVKQNKLPFITIKNYEEIIIPHEEAFMCLCCNMYYTKAGFAEKHAHKDFDALKAHNAKTEEYLEQYADKMKYNINGKKAAKDIQNTRSLGYEIVYKTVPECSWTGTKMSQIVDQEATYKNQLAYEATLPKTEQITDPDLVPMREKKIKQAKASTEASSTGDISKDFILKIVKQTFQELSIKEEDNYRNQRFQNTIVDKVGNNEEVTSDILEEEIGKLTEDLEKWEIEGFEEELIKIACPELLRKKIGMSYKTLLSIVKA
jgi:hypothetical protein